MSYFRVALQREAERRRLTQADLARMAGLSRSYISRLLGGEHADLSDENFTAILKIFAADKRAQAEIVAARCMDARVGPGSELVEINIKGSGAGKREHGDRDPGADADAATSLPQVELAQETERAFAWLRSQCPVNADLEKHLVGYARLTGMR